MTLATFVAFAKEALASHLDREGSILYGAAKTLQAGDLYVLGFNPGGTGGSTIGQNLDALPAQVENAYVHEEWENERSRFGAGKAPLQQRVKWLTEALGHPIEDVCASNLVFMKSRDWTGIKYPADADACWPVHERMLEIVRPKLVIAIGNDEDRSAYAYLRQRFGGRKNEGRISADHGSWQCKGFAASDIWGSFYVAGLPHLSYYSPSGKRGVVEWISSNSGVRESDQEARI